MKVQSEGVLDLRRWLVDHANELLDVTKQKLGCEDVCFKAWGDEVVKHPFPLFLSPVGKVDEFLHYPDIDEHGFVKFWFNVKISDRSNITYYPMYIGRKDGEPVFLLFDSADDRLDRDLSKWFSLDEASNCLIEWIDKSVSVDTANSHFL
ncbi:hypothetical protein [Vibrio paucivorans]